MDWLRVWLIWVPTVLTVLTGIWLVATETRKPQGKWGAILATSIALSWFIWALWFCLAFVTMFLFALVAHFVSHLLP